MTESAERAPVNAIVVRTSAEETFGEDNDEKEEQKETESLRFCYILY